jgi:hypothetical protein
MLHCARDTIRLCLVRRPDAGAGKLLHRLVGELGARSVTPNHKHQDVLLVRIAGRHVLEPADCTRWKGNDVERTELHVLHLTMLVLPAAAPFPRHWNECFVGIVIMHHAAVLKLSNKCGDIPLFSGYRVTAWVTIGLPYALR